MGEMKSKICYNESGLTKPSRTGRFRANQAKLIRNWNNLASRFSMQAVLPHTEANHLVQPSIVMDVDEAFWSA